MKMLRCKQHPDFQIDAKKSSASAVQWHLFFYHDGSFHPIEETFEIVEVAPDASV